MNFLRHEPEAPSALGAATSIGFDAPPLRRAGAADAPVGCVKVLTSAAHIPVEDWERLAPPDDPLWNQALFLAMEKSSIGPDAYRYLVLFQQDRLQAVLPVCIFGGLSLEDVLGAQGRRFLRPLRPLASRLLRIRLLLCGHLLGQGRVLRAPGTTPAAAQLLVDAVQDLAQQFDSRWIVFKDFAERDVEWLHEALQHRRFFLAPGLPDAVLQLSTTSFESYIATLSKNGRNEVRSKLKKFSHHDDVRLEVCDTFSDLVPAMMPLYHAVFERSETRLDVWTPEFFTLVSNDPRIRAKLIACWKHDQLIGFLLCLLDDESVVVGRIGLDYAASIPLQLYFILQYRCIEETMSAGCRKLYFGQTTYEPKRRMGCHPAPLMHAVTHRNPLIRAALRQFLPLALNQSGQEFEVAARTLPDTTVAADANPSVSRASHH